MLVKNPDGTFLMSIYDAAGNLVATDNERGDVTSFTYDAFNHVATELLPAATIETEAATRFVYDPAGDLLQRQMPGGIVQVMTYDNSGRKMSEELRSGATVSRHFDFVYYLTGAFVGKIQTVSDPRGFTTTTTYDDFLRPIRLVSSGSPVPEQNQTTRYQYDRRNSLVEIAQAYEVASTGDSSDIRRGYSGYGNLTLEILSRGGVVTIWRQTWNASGWRTALTWGSYYGGWSTLGTANYSFGYRADGLLKSVTDGGTVAQFSYGDNRRLIQRTNPWRTQTITSRDNRGRILTESNTVGLTTPLAEVLAWRTDAKIGSYTANRTGAGVWNETRNYGYNTRGQLLNEPYKPGASLNEAFTYQFDANSEAGPGVRTMAQVTPSKLYNVSAESPLLRVTQETKLPGDGSNETLGWTYDALGEVLTRTLSGGGGTQTCTWDSFGRMVRVQQRDAANNGLDWSATYDGLGRRLRTNKQVVTGGVASSAIESLDSYYDPEVEFLELGVANKIYGIMQSRTWKMFGPDLSGHYGGAQGIGGLEGTIDEQSGTATGVLNDYFGNVVGSVSGGVTTWNTANVGGYGVLPGSAAVALDASHSVAQTTLWRSHYIDPTGFYYLGARYYDPQSGRFLSPDPLGHGSSISLYDYANGDPVNGLDPDGRIATQVGSAASNTWNMTKDVVGSIPQGLALAAHANAAGIGNMFSAVKEGYDIFTETQSVEMGYRWLRGPKPGETNNYYITEADQMGRNLLRFPEVRDAISKTKDMSTGYVAWYRNAGSEPLEQYIEGLIFDLVGRNRTRALQGSIGGYVFVNNSELTVTAGDTLGLESVSHEPPKVSRAFGLDKLGLWTGKTYRENHLFNDNQFGEIGIGSNVNVYYNVKTIR